ncbi:uncharacterized protein LOC134658603 [Cydia amplana]|uniref:uncharacterized protein LOC134658603 n=1 Tax=Cydia amplana TaxID=1869771 RepID=UPI002FE6B120
MSDDERRNRGQNVAPTTGSGTVAAPPPSQPGTSTSGHGSSATGGYHVEKLNGHQNFNSWKFVMRNILIIDGLWKCVLGEDLDPTRDERALARICLSVASTCHQYVQNAKTSKEAWTNLVKVFEDSGLARKVLLLRKLHRIELSTFSTMTEYIQETMALVQQLADINKVIEDGEVAEILLSGLPKDYETLVTNLETVSMTSTLSSEIVRTRLLQEEARRADASPSNGTAFMSKPSSVPNLRRCTYCGKNGHLKKSCFKLKRKKKEDQAASKGLLASAFAASSSDFLIDSGCSQTMVQCSELFQSIKPTNSEVIIANNSKLKCIGSGEVELQFNNNDNALKLNNVLLVPDLSANLLSDTGLQELKDCATCLKGKMASQPYPSASTHRASQALQLIHSDVMGPLPVESWGGSRYVVTFTDDHTRMTHAYTLKKKNEVLATFINYKNLVEKQYGLPIRTLRSDGGGEYCSHAFTDYLTKHGIVHQTTVPYSPSQNGVSERLNRILLDKVRCMLFESGLDNRFWAEALMTAVYLKNRSPTSALSGHTPLEKLTGLKPNLSHLHTFGDDEHYCTGSEHDGSVSSPDEESPRRRVTSSDAETPPQRVTPPSRGVTHSGEEEISVPVSPVSSRRPQ